MTEAQWLACTDVEQLLAFLRPKASDRKLRLFACACCRNIWYLLSIGACRTAVEVAERYADGLAIEKEVCTAWANVGAAVKEEGITQFDSFDPYETELLEWGYSPEGLAVYATSKLVGVGAVEARDVAQDTAYAVAGDIRHRLCGQGAEEVAFREALKTEKAGQALLFREVMGNPFRRVAIKARWLAWNEHTVQRIAQVIYDTRAYDLLPIIADALEDAGCENDAILTHCRGPGLHVRGCWVIDLLLGKS